MKFLDELANLKIPRDQFAIFGSGPMAVRGLRENNDIDIIVRPAVWAQLSVSYPMTNEGDNQCVKFGNIAVYNHWRPLFNNMDELIDEADELLGFRFVKLERVLEWKKAFNREKDKRDVELIMNYLKKNAINS